MQTEQLTTRFEPQQKLMAILIPLYMFKPHWCHFGVGLAVAV